ncbi:unnamed protein product, partial [Mesorhabditis belari]|uniref:Uncharacterized protein n=1 Tax=Mesorhabditis belari TaxID=2138241 RepID=A0AAF3FNI6_9BILA
MRELEQISQSIQDGESRNRNNQTIERNDESNSEVPQDPQPILSVLCSLVDEIGTLRKENRRLKTRLTLPPPRMNMIQRMSTILDSRGITLPKMRRQPERKPPLVQPEMTDSDVEDTAFDEPLSSTSSQPRRSTLRRRDLSISECTSPSSASSRDPSENMTSSRSSFFEFFGLKKRKEVINSVSDLLMPRVVTRRKRKSSRDNEEVGRDERQRQRVKVGNWGNDDTVPIRSTSFLTAVYEKDKFEQDAMLRVDRETRLRHERDNFGAEVQELKTRNERLVEQLREKSSLFSRLQAELGETEREIESYRKKCQFDENIERLSLSERFTRNHSLHLSKIEERLRQFETKLQTSRAEIAVQHQAVRFCL